MSDYNLSDNVNDSFRFEVGGIKYEMRYPIVEELENLQELLADEKNTDKVQSEFYKFITPIDATSPPITDIMKKQTIRVLKNFNDMLRAEFGTE